MIYDISSWKENCIGNANRADVALLTHLRSGHTPLLKAYAHLLEHYVPTVHEEAANSGKLAEEMPEPHCFPATYLQQSFTPTRSPHNRPREGALTLAP